MATLTTSPQEIRNNTGNTIATRLFAWYTDQSGNDATVHLKLQACSQGITYTGTNKAYAMTCGSTDTDAISWPNAPLNANTWYDVAEITFQASGGSQIYCRGSVWTYVYGDSVCETSDVYLPNFYTNPNMPSVSGSNADAFTNKITFGTSSFGNPNAGTVYLYGDESTSPTTQVASKTSTGNSTVTLSNLKPNTTYRYRARAKNNANLWSGYSGVITIKTKPAALVPYPNDPAQKNTGKYVKKMEVPLNGLARNASKIYRSVGGKAQRIY